MLDSQKRGRLPLGTKLVIITIVVLLASFLIVAYIALTTTLNGIHIHPTGVWGPKTIGPEEVTVEFGRVTPRPEPVDMNLVLVRNGTTAGRYAFASNNDGELTFFNGEEVGTLTYADLADNERIDIGDKIVLTNLAPDSNYELIMIWVPTGDDVTSTTFSTPTG
jgi:hypothetical protein